jgi:hypothetical protein
MRFRGIILRVLRHEVSIYNVYITNQFQTRGSKIRLLRWLWIARSKIRKIFVSITSKNSASGLNIEAFQWETRNLTVSSVKLLYKALRITFFSLASVVKTLRKFVKGQTHRVHGIEVGEVYPPSQLGLTPQLCL